MTTHEQYDYTKESLAALVALYLCAKSAIKAGDWKVDGACDPEAALALAKRVLHRAAWS